MLLFVGGVRAPARGTIRVHRRHEEQRGGDGGGHWSLRQAAEPRHAHLYG